MIKHVFVSKRIFLSLAIPHALKTNFWGEFKELLKSFSYLEAPYAIPPLTHSRNSPFTYHQFIILSAFPCKTSFLGVLTCFVTAMERSSVKNCSMLKRLHVLAHRLTSSSLRTSGRMQRVHGGYAIILFRSPQCIKLHHFSLSGCWWAFSHHLSCLATIKFKTPH